MIDLLLYHKIVRVECEIREENQIIIEVIFKIILFIYLFKRVCNIKKKIMAMK